LDRAGALLTLMERERQVQSDITLKTGRIAGHWNGLVERHVAAIKSKDAQALQSVRTELSTVAKRLAASPDVVAELRANGPAYGVTATGTLGKALAQADVGKALANAITPAPTPKIERGGPSM
jgi:hypothetical protein